MELPRLSTIPILPVQSFLLDSEVALTTSLTLFQVFVKYKNEFDDLRHESLTNMWENFPSTTFVLFIICFVRLKCCNAGSVGRSLAVPLDWPMQLSGCLKCAELWICHRVRSVTHVWSDKHRFHRISLPFVTFHLRQPRVAQRLEGFEETDYISLSGDESSSGWLTGARWDLGRAWGEGLTVRKWAPDNRNIFCSFVCVSCSDCSTKKPKRW